MHSSFDLLRGYSYRLFPTLSEELRELTGIDNGYVRCGGLEFLSGAEETGQEWHSEGLSLQTLEEPALARLEPNLASGLGRANYLPEMAQVRNPRHLKALLAACKSCRVALQSGCAVHGFVSAGRRITAVKTLGGNFPAERFLLATGAWTSPLLDGLGCNIPIQPVRGQIALLNSGPHLAVRIPLPGATCGWPGPGRLHRRTCGLRQTHHGTGHCRLVVSGHQAGPIFSRGPPRTLLGRSSTGQPGWLAVPGPDSRLGQSLRRRRPFPGRHPALSWYGPGLEGMSARPAVVLFPGTIRPATGPWKGSPKRRQGSFSLALQALRAPKIPNSTDEGFLLT